MLPVLRKHFGRPPPPAPEASGLIRYVVEQTARLEWDLADCLHDLALRVGREGRADEAADYRDASIRHRVRALEVQAVLAVAGAASGPALDPGLHRRPTRANEGGAP